MAADDDTRSDEAAKDSTDAQPTKAQGSSPSKVPDPLAPPAGVPLPPELSPAADTGNAGSDNPEIQRQLDRMRDTVEQQRKSIADLDAKIEEAKDHERQLRGE